MKYFDQTLVNTLQRTRSLIHRRMKQARNGKEVFTIQALGLPDAEYDPLELHLAFFVVKHFELNLELMSLKVSEEPIQGYYFICGSEIGCKLFWKIYRFMLNQFSSVKAQMEEICRGYLTPYIENPDCVDAKMLGEGQTCDLIDEIGSLLDTAADERI